ncbi:MAG: glycosyltransferase [Sedimenticola sp.]
MHITRHKVIGALGRFTSEKGFDDLIQALSILKNKGVNYHAVIGGSGGGQKNLKSLSSECGLEDNITFPGWIDDKNNFFSKIDIFCLPSRSESFGIVLLEAMRCRVPVVSTDCDGPREIIDPDVSGIITPINDPQSLASALEYIICHGGVARGLASNAYNALVNTYSKKVVSGLLNDVLAEISPKDSSLRILNITHSRKWGGLEQAFVDYESCLVEKGHRVLSLVSDNSQIASYLDEIGSEYIETRHVYKKYGSFSLISLYFFRKLLGEFKPDVILLHNARCLNVLKKVAHESCPLVVVSHGANERKNCGADYVIAVNQLIKERNFASCHDIKSVFVVPNMIDL